MKRDMDLVRGILLQTELSDGALDSGALSCLLERDKKEVAAHIELLADAGLVKASAVRAMGGAVHATVEGLTWKGYDYLDAVRSDKVWRRARKAVAEAVGDTSIWVMKEICVALAISMVKGELHI